MGRAPLIAVLVSVIAVGVASAQEQTRETYVAQVDPICARADKAGQRMSRRVNPLLRRGQYELAGRLYGRYWRGVFKPAIREIASVSRPPADSGLIASWLGIRYRQGRLGDAAAVQLRHGKLKSALRKNKRIQQLDHQADDLLRPLGFKSCDV